MKLTEINEPMYFEIRGEPKNKQQARIGFNKKTGKRFVFQPDGVHDYAEVAKAQIRRQLFGAIDGWHNLIEGAIGAEITILYPLPKSWSKKKKAELGGTLKNTKPDADNTTKAILDPFTKLVWVDDCQVHLQGVYRVWSPNVQEVTSMIRIVEVDSTF